MPNKRATPLGPGGWCEECQQHHTSKAGKITCRGHSQGRPCRRFPNQGMEVCDTHGGASPAAKAKVARAKAEQRAETALRNLIPDSPAPITDPIATLAQLGGEIDALRAAAADALNQAFRGNQHTLDDFAVLAVYERTVDRLVRICESLVRSNYLERRAAVEEAEAVALLAAVQAGLRLIDDAALRQRVTAAVASNVRALTA